MGDIEENGLIEKYLGSVPAASGEESNVTTPSPLTQEYVELIKKDANQAQILQGWIVGTITDK